MCLVALYSHALTTLAQCIRSGPCPSLQCAHLIFAHMLEGFINSEGYKAKSSAVGLWMSAWTLELGGFTTDGKSKVEPDFEEDLEEQGRSETADAM